MQVGTTRRTDEQKISIGLIGRGAIGGTVASIVEQGDVPGITLGAVMTRTPPSDRGGVRWTAMLDELLDLDIDLVVEAAGPEAFKAMVPDVLASGRDVIAVSVAAMADSAVEKAVNRPWPHRVPGFTLQAAPSGESTRCPQPANWVSIQWSWCSASRMPPSPTNP